MAVSKKFLALLCAIFLLSQAFVTQLFGQGIITYQASGLGDSNPGQDLWQYSYPVSGVNFQLNQGFSIFFISALHSNLVALGFSRAARWDTSAVQPDFGLSQPGYFDAQALRNFPTTADPFAVNFIWRGVGTPGSQPFTIYDSSFQPIFSGVTTAVPSFSRKSGQEAENLRKENRHVQKSEEKLRRRIQEAGWQENAGRYLESAASNGASKKSRYPKSRYPLSRLENVKG